MGKEARKIQGTPIGRQLFFKHSPSPVKEEKATSLNFANFLSGAEKMKKGLEERERRHG